ncbi:PREDICTED: probable G-protein coupled receptor No9 [Priapulus caudatus]|uniref:Probable G-protein coupled receptor No9 n=1 Tax=Priapulus caudatus TaxID=37621 RepID=A0ABM1F9F0_PRICU|nr:PREDICTED: probable G-protein coupled receptor No9 [Priapulus caudatus]
MSAAVALPAPPPPDAAAAASAPCVDVLSRPASWHIVASFAALVLIAAVIVCGNALVVTAVVVTKKLRTTTNLFICSLAVADLLVGIAVLPYSLTLEVLDEWLFDEVWCSLWLAIDVLLCTASILHLCAISLDRYIAIAYPMHYPRLMVPARGKALIVVVWVVAFLVCIPPLLGWNEVGAPLRRALEDGAAGNASASDACTLISDRGYRVYSALGSFFIPMFVMAFFYWRIYVLATRSSRAMKRGFKEVTGRAGGGLRIHRGGGTVRLAAAAQAAMLTSRSISREDSLVTEPPSPVLQCGRKSGILQFRSSDPADKRAARRQLSEQLQRSKSDVDSVPSSGSINSLENGTGCSRQPQNGGGFGEEAIDGDTSGTHRLHMILKLRRDFKKFTREMKAAKTLGIIVGAFIVCWLPFFTIYFVEAFCSDCIPSLVFSVCFWLGYCNSGINPFVYAMFSRDYRSTFNRILRCRLGRDLRTTVTLTSCQRLSRMESDKAADLYDSSLTWQSRPAEASCAKPNNY